MPVSMQRDETPFSLSDVVGLLFIYLLRVPFCFILTNRACFIFLTWMSFLGLRDVMYFIASEIWQAR